MDTCLWLDHTGGASVGLLVWEVAINVAASLGVKDDFPNSGVRNCSGAEGGVVDLRWGDSKFIPLGTAVGIGKGEVCCPQK